jgi:hypothetical protein
MSAGEREQQTPARAAVPSGKQSSALARRAGLVVLAAAVLFFCYWRQSCSVPLSSDGSANVLQAWDMLHGNVLLHNWWVSDVSFYTTELPQYMIIEAVLGMGPWVVHAGAAMTYTLLVLLAGLLAKGRSTGGAGLARAVLAGGIMLAPQLSATSTLLLSPDHTGTAVPLLVIWLLIDRYRPGRLADAWLLAELTGLLFAWTMVADSDVLLTGIIPLVLACVARACWRLVRREERAASRRYELGLAAAAAAAGVVGSFVPRVLAALGGYQQWHVGTDTDLGQMQHGAWVTLQAFLELLGANLFPSNYAYYPGSNAALEVVFVAVHLAGVVVVTGALVLAARRFFRSADLIVPAFFLAVLLNLGAYMISTHAQDLLGAREIAAVLPLGAVLAGRLLGEPALAVARAAANRAKGWLLAAPALLAAGYLGALAYGAAQPAVPPTGQALAAWLVAHRLSDGLSGYWQANSTTLASRGRVLVSAVMPSVDGGLVPYDWETDVADYDPSRHDANFVVAAGPDAPPGLLGDAESAFGLPTQTYHTLGYTILVWHENLLEKLAGGLHVQDAAPGDHSESRDDARGDQAKIVRGKIPLRRREQQDQRQEIGLDQRAPVAERARPDLAGQQAQLQHEEHEGHAFVDRRGRDEQHEQAGHDEDRKRGVFQQVDIDRAQMGRVDVRESVLERVVDRGEGHRQVAAGVRDQREFSLEHEMGRQFERAVHGGRHHPGQVRPAGPLLAPEHRDDPGHGDGGRGEQNGLPGQRAGGEHHGGQDRPRPAVGQQAAQHARLGERLGGVAADADDQPEVGGKGEPPQRVTAGLAGEHAAEDGHGGHADQVDRDEGDGDEPVLAEGDQPGQERVADPRVPVGLVHGDAERGLGPVERVQREPVVELPVVSRVVRVADHHARRQLLRMRVPVRPRAQQHKQARVPLRPDLQAGQDEAQPAEEGDHAGHDRPVQPRPQRWRSPSDGAAFIRSRGELQPRTSGRNGQFWPGARSLPEQARLCPRLCQATLTGRAEHPKDVVPAVHTSGTPQKSAAPRAVVGGDPRSPRRRPQAQGRRPLIALALVLVVALLFLGYLQVSRTYATNSDEANDLLMAWDMLHGNVLLHGWYLSDVSFYTTELPQYALLEFLFGLHPGTAHIAAAMTYTLALVFAVLLARGKRADRGAEGPARTLLTAGIMLAPQLGVGVFIVLLSLGHIGTSVPLMLTFLVIDRIRPRWYVPVLVGLLLTWVFVADQLVLLAGIVPLAAVCLLRVIREMPAARRAAADAGSGWLRACLRARWYELSLAVAALAAWPAASGISRLLSASGGFVLHPIGYTLAPLSTWPKHARVSAEGLLAMFGAKPQGTAPELAFAVVHLAGVALVAWAVCRVVRHFLSWPDLISQVLLVAMILNIAAYVPSTLADATDLNAREFAVVLPFGAVLAGRALAPVIASRWTPEITASWSTPKITVVRALLPGALLAAALLAGYGASLGYAAAQPSAPPANSELAEFLAAHHLGDGVGGYWQSSIVTVQSGGTVTIRALLPGTLQPDLWEAKASWYDPGVHRATFLVTDDQPGFFNHWMPNSAALAAYGPPIRTYHVGPYTIMVWDKNLLAAGRAP